MIDQEILNMLRQIVGAGQVLTGRAAEEVYGYDASLGRARPDAVLLPGNCEEVAKIVRALGAARIPYTPRGFGTNLSGGSIAAHGGVVICLTRMNRIVSIQPERRCAIVEPGVTNLELQNALAPFGFFFAPDPASQKVATLGGNVAENSGGPHCIKHGVTTNHILGMQVVLPGGAVVNIAGAALDPPGYDLRGVLVGSEGTLAIVTQTTVRILPVAETVATLLAIYDEAGDAARSVSDVIAEGIVPATLEMMDAPVMRAVEESYPCGYPLDAAAVLIAEVDGPAAGLRDQVERIRQICLKNGSRTVREAKDAAERDLLWSGRRGAFGAVARLAPSYLVADCSVPRTKLPEALSRIAAIAKRHDLTHGNVFHAGDGNLHPLLFLDSRIPNQVRSVHEAGEAIMKLCVELGGTITGEHGVGTEKAFAMRMLFSPQDLQFQRSLRKAFNPDGLLNPGKIIPAFDTDEDATPASQRFEWKHQEMPASDQEAVEIVRWAYHDSGALLPSGLGTRKDFGNLPRKAEFLLGSRRLSRVRDYDPANQTVTAESGLTLRGLQGLLAGNNQWLPIRPVRGQDATLGGIAALGSCGPERLRYGAPRDRILGLRFVSGRGNLIVAGGKVIKNVAGYDVTRLMIGSAGTLGFLTELTFRIASMPQVCKAIQAIGTLEQCSEAAVHVLRSKLDPVFVVSIPAGDGLDGSQQRMHQLTVGFEGFTETVQWQCTQGMNCLRQSGLANLTECAYPLLEGPFAGQYASLEACNVLLRTDVPLDRVPGAARALNSLPGQPRILVDFGCGRILAGCRDLAVEVWAELCSFAADREGHIVIEKAPALFKVHQDVFGPVRPEWEIIHKLKDKLDPRGVFAPGRLPGRK